MRLLFVFPQWHFNIEALLKALSRRAEVETLHFHSQDEVQQVGRIGVPGVVMHDLGLWKKVHLASSEFWIPQPSDLWQKLDGYDCVVFKNIYDPVSLLGFLFCRLKGIPFIVSEQKIKDGGGFLRIAQWKVRYLYLPLIRIRKGMRSSSDTPVVGNTSHSPSTRSRFPSIGSSGGAPSRSST
jgi:hypothetical protein